MATFEDQLSDSAKRIKRADNEHLHVPQISVSSKRTYWGKVATPAAAVVGLVIGLAFPQPADVPQPEMRFVEVHDTISVPQYIKDTVYLTKIEERERIIWRDREPQIALIEPVEPSDLTLCTSVSCDGIDYSLLVLK